MKKYYGYIYKITHTPSGRYYIGQHKGCDPDHDGYLGSGKVWLKIVESHPLLEFRKEVLATASSRKELSVLEAEFIDDLYLADPLCKNCVAGGGTPPDVRSLTKEQEEKRRKNLSLAMSTETNKKKVSERFKGKHLSPETKKHISESHKGLKPTDETRKKMSESAKKRPKRELSEEHKMKIAASILRWHNLRKGAE